MKNFILLLAGVQSVSITSIVLELLDDRRLVIVSPHSLILDHDGIAQALVNESVVLVVPDLAFLSSFELLVCFLFDHGSVCIQVLSLKSDFFQLLGKTGFFGSLLFLLVVDLAMCFQETLFSRGLLFGS